MEIVDICSAVVPELKCKEVSNSCGGECFEHGSGCFVRVSIFSSTSHATHFCWRGVTQSCFPFFCRWLLSWLFKFLPVYPATVQCSSSRWQEGRGRDGWSQKWLLRDELESNLAPDCLMTPSYRVGCTLSCLVWPVGGSMSYCLNQSPINHIPDIWWWWYIGFSDWQAWVTDCQN